MRRQLAESKQINVRLEDNIRELNVSLEQSLGNAGRENENLKKRLSEYEAKLTQLSLELTRLNEILRVKS